MKYVIHYESQYRNDVLDWKEVIRATNDVNARRKAIAFVDGLSRKAAEENSRKTYKLTDVSRLTFKRVVARKRQLRSIGL